MESIKPVPPDFEQWCLGRMTPDPVYYKNHQNYAECHCGKCNKAFRLRFKTGNETYEEEMAQSFSAKPVRHKAAVCPVCAHNGFWEWDRVKRARYEYASFWLIQRTVDDNLIVRVFQYVKRVQNGEASRIKSQEVRRYLATPEGAKIYKNTPSWKGNRWAYGWQLIKCGTVDWIYCEGIYPGWEDEIALSRQRYFKGELVKRPDVQSFTQALMAYANNPALEIYVKMGMKKLAEELIENYGKSRYINRKGKNAGRQLRLGDRQRIRFLTQQNGGLVLLHVLQQEEKAGIQFTDGERAWLEDQIPMHEGQLKVLLRYMSVRQLMNRCQKYRGMRYPTDGAVIGAYADYISMREELGYDMSNSVFIYPRSLAGCHDKMTEESNKRKDELYIKRKQNQYGRIKERCAKLEKKYVYSSGGLVIRPARDAGEIIMEGRTLHHCVGSDSYLKKHNEGKSVILFLRREETPDEPYITVEVRGSSVVQWYGLHDGKPDKEHIDRWMEEYVAEIGGKSEGSN
ncbi:MAG: PcfJ domain-containing protein [Acetatifactor muris]|nr:PcfJ domain-containing protein [Acetatifactor muris]